MTQTTPPMVEKVARAILRTYKTFGGDPVPDAVIDDGWPICVTEAEAAIAAMREPSEGMAFAGMSAKAPPHDGKTNSLDRGKLVTSAIFTAMIDAALTGDQG